MSKVKDKEVDVFTKSAFEEIRAGISTYKGRRLAYVRIYASYPDRGQEDYDEDDYRPTKKGISLNLKDVARLKKAVDALAEAAEDELQDEEE